MFLYPICQEENSIPVIFLTAAAHPTENRPRRRDRRGKIAAKVRKDRKMRAQIPNIPGMICFSIRYVKRKILFRSFFFDPSGGRSAVILAAGPPRPRRICMAFMIDGAERELRAPRQRGGDEQH